MTAEQIEAAGIQVAPVAAGVLVSRVVVPGVLSANSDRLARVTARVAGTIAEVRKRLGEQVVAGDVVAVIESREIADAKGEFLMASRAANLTGLTLAREARLWKHRISAEQDFLQARASDEEATVRLDLARQRLSSLGLSDREIVDLAPRRLSRAAAMARRGAKVVFRKLAEGGMIHRLLGVGILPRCRKRLACDSTEISRVDRDPDEPTAPGVLGQLPFVSASQWRPAILRRHFFPWHWQC